MAADGTFLWDVMQLKSCVKFSCVIRSVENMVDTFLLSSLITQYLGLCLSDCWPPLFSTSIFFSPLPGPSCTLSWQPCRHAVSPPELKDSAAPWMCLSWERRRKESLRAREKSSVGEAKDGIDGGKNELCFHVHSLSFWCTHQNNLRPTAATPSG